MGSSEPETFENICAEHLLIQKWYSCARPGDLHFCMDKKGHTRCRKLEIYLFQYRFCCFPIEPILFFRVKIFWSSRVAGKVIPSFIPPNTLLKTLHERCSPKTTLFSALPLVPPFLCTPKTNFDAAPGIRLLRVLAGHTGTRIPSVYTGIIVVLLTLTHGYNAVRGHRTGSTNSGAEDLLRRENK